MFCMERTKLLRKETVKSYDNGGKQEMNIDDYIKI